MPIDLLYFSPATEVDAVTKRLRSGGIVLARGRSDWLGGLGLDGGGMGEAVKRMTQSEMDTSLDRLFDGKEAKMLVVCPRSGRVRPRTSRW